MMMVFVLGERERAAVKEAVQFAREHPIPLDQLIPAAVPIPEGGVLSLADRDPLVPPPRRQIPVQILIPFGYRLAITGEQQPPGRCLHISLSVSVPDRVPNEHAMAMVVEACGKTPDDLLSVWLEEFLIDGFSGGRAVNMVLRDWDHDE